MPICGLFPPVIFFGIPLLKIWKQENARNKMANRKNVVANQRKLNSRWMFDLYTKLIVYKRTLFVVETACS